MGLRRHGFTLIELLVVIGVIALLLGIMLPALAGARETARQTKCLGSVQQLVQGLTCYSTDYREIFPHWSAWQVYQGDGSSNEDTPGPGWAELMEQYVDTFEAYQCANRRQDAIKVAYFLQSKYTASLTNRQFYKSLKHAQVDLSDKFVLTGDATNPYLFSEPYGGPHQVPNVDPDDAREPATLYAGEKERIPHKHGSNIGFLDGHGALFNTYERHLMTWHGREMKSWDEVN